MTTLEEFYYGSIIPHEIPIIKGSEYDTANRLVVRHDEALTATLTEQQKETFQKFKDSYLEIGGFRFSFDIPIDKPTVMDLIFVVNKADTAFFKCRKYNRFVYSLNQLARL